MNQENTAKLLQAFPELFRDSDKTCMQRGFETGDGWFKLIYELCQNIEQEMLKAGICRSSDDWPRVEQVKSKFGTLRFYLLNRLSRNSDSVNTRMEFIRKLIADAVDRSAAICEDCGALGTLRQDAGLYTSCEACKNARQ